MFLNIVYIKCMGINIPPYFCLRTASAARNTRNEVFFPPPEDSAASSQEEEEEEESGYEKKGGDTCLGLFFQRGGGIIYPWHTKELRRRTGARAAPSSIQKRENVGWKNAWDTRFPSGEGEGLVEMVSLFSGCCQNGSGV